MTKIEQEKNILDVVAERLAERWTTPNYVNYELAVTLLEIGVLEQLCSAELKQLSEVNDITKRLHRLQCMVELVQKRLKNLGRPMYRSDLVAEYNNLDKKKVTNDHGPNTAR